MKLNKSDITIFIIDDEFFIRDSLTLLIETTGLNVESFESAEVFLKKFSPYQPGCILLDCSMPGMGGLELQKELDKTCKGMPILFMSGQADISVFSQAFRGGAVDFLEKPFENDILLTRIDEMVEMLRITWYQCQEKRKILNRYVHLTPREKEVFKLTVQNHSNKQTARMLGISNRTVDVHRSHVMNKMKADSLNTLIVLAMTAGILSIEDIDKKSDDGLGDSLIYI